MDPQKQKTELKPEFQEIYERIMNTPVKQGSPTASPAQQKTQPSEPSQPAVEPTPPPQSPSYGAPNVPPPPPMAEAAQSPPVRTSPATPFVFSSSQTASAETTGEEVKKRGIVGKVITTILILVLLAVYTLFWLFFFKVIDPSILPFSLPF